jgi:hypothetical protein
LKLWLLKIRKGLVWLWLCQCEQRWNCSCQREADQYDSVGRHEYTMTSKADQIEWLQRQTEEYHSGMNSANDLVEELEGEGKLGQGFSAVDELEEIDIGDRLTPRPTYISAKLLEEQREKMHQLIQEFTDCFA